jgi:hypothetical protein
MRTDSIFHHLQSRNNISIYFFTEPFKQMSTKHFYTRTKDYLNPFFSSVCQGVAVTIWRWLSFDLNLHPPIQVSEYHTFQWPKELERMWIFLFEDLTARDILSRYDVGVQLFNETSMVDIMTKYMHNCICIACYKVVKISIIIFSINS